MKVRIISNDGKIKGVARIDEMIKKYGNSSLKYALDGIAIMLGIYGGEYKVYSIPMKGGAK